MREKAQVLLSRMVWSNPAEGRGATASDSKQPLSVGLHFEILLKSSVLQWKGVADLIDVRPGSVAIVDFKTGEPSPQHAEQVRTYALLWAHDVDANPRSRLATDLVLSYPTGNIGISAPHEAELRTMELDLLARTTSAKTAMRAHEPVALVAPEHCSQCDVKHLCSEYWIAKTRKSLIIGNQSEFDDVEVLIEERLGESNWKCKCLVATHVPIGSSVLLRVGNDDATLTRAIELNSIFRVVGALISSSKDSPLVASIVGSSELFRVPKGL